MEGILAKIVDQLPAAVLIVVFMAYVMRWLDRRDTQRDDRQASHDFDIQSSMDDRDKLMRQFWESQQTSNRDVLERVATSVEKVVEKLDIHDQKTDVAIAKMEERTTKRVATAASKPKP